MLPVLMPSPRRPLVASPHAYTLPSWVTAQHIYYESWLLGVSYPDPGACWWPLCMHTPCHPESLHSVFIMRVGYLVFNAQSTMHVYTLPSWVTAQHIYYESWLLGVQRPVNYACLHLAILSHCTAYLLWELVTWCSTPSQLCMSTSCHPESLHSIFIMRVGYLVFNAQSTMHVYILPSCVIAQHIYYESWLLGVQRPVNYACLHLAILSHCTAYLLWELVTWCSTPSQLCMSTSCHPVSLHSIFIMRVGYLVFNAQSTMHVYILPLVTAQHIYYESWLLGVQRPVNYACLHLAILSHCTAYLLWELVTWCSTPSQLCMSTSCHPESLHSIFIMRVGYLVFNAQSTMHVYILPSCVIAQHIYYESWLLGVQRPVNYACLHLAILSHCTAYLLWELVTWCSTPSQLCMSTSCHPVSLHSIFIMRVGYLVFNAQSTMHVYILPSWVTAQHIYYESWLLGVQRPVNYVCLHLAILCHCTAYLLYEWVTWCLMPCSPSCPVSHAGLFEANLKVTKSQMKSDSLAWYFYFQENGGGGGGGRRRG